APAQQSDGPARDKVFRIEPFHVLKIRARDTSPVLGPVDGVYLVEPSGKVDLGPGHGKVEVAGLQLEEAAEAVEKHLRKESAECQVSLTLAGWVTKWENDPSRQAPYRIQPYHFLTIHGLQSLPGRPLDGTYLVEPSGKVDLGPGYGRVAV